jgi:hypothetical protein
MSLFLLEKEKLKNRNLEQQFIKELLKDNFNLKLKMEDNFIMKWLKNTQPYVFLPDLLKMKLLLN